MGRSMPQKDEMAGLNHNFLVIDTNSFSLNDYDEYQSADNVELHDDFLHYIADSLSWISSFNPAMEENCNGLCFYGPTIIFCEGIEKAKSIFLSWLNLFKQGPDKLVLTGSFSWVEGEPIGSGSYDKLTFNRVEIVDKLYKLVMFCDIVENSNGTKCFLHLGI